MAGVRVVVGDEDSLSREQRGLFGKSVRLALGGGTSRGSVTVVVPRPTSLATSIVPFIISTSCFVIESPSPVPPALRASSLSPCSNASASSWLGSMPHPVSETVKRIDLPERFWTLRKLASTRVNFPALLRRFQDLPKP